MIQVCDYELLNMYLPSLTNAHRAFRPTELAVYYPRHTGQ